MNTKRKDLIDNLNLDLAAEDQAMIMYNSYAAGVLGEHRKQLRELFLQEIPDEMEHAKYLADKIVSLGGKPTLSVSKVPKAENDCEMLENVLKAEAETIHRYGQRRLEAEELGELALMNDLEEMISDETRHKEECEKILRGFIPQS